MERFSQRTWRISGVKQKKSKKQNGRRQKKLLLFLLFNPHSPYKITEWLFKSVIIRYDRCKNRTWKTFKMMNPQGEALKVGFDGSLKLDFHGAKVTSDAGLLAYRDLGEALGLFGLASRVLYETRTGRNIQHDMRALLRQSVYSRLGGYEDGNDAGRLSVDPARYLTFQMAEVSIDRDIFAEILSRIKQLRCGDV